MEEQFDMLGDNVVTGKKGSSCLKANGWSTALRRRHNGLLTKWKLSPWCRQGRTLARIQADLKRENTRKGLF